MIKGLTDRRIIRRDGKIRSGHKNEKDFPVNDPHFLLHDAKQLIPVLGENPTEIYCTFIDDNLDASAPADLRYYTKSELICQSTHKVPEGIEPPLTTTAAYYALGEAAGVKVGPHPWIPRARERICKHRQCPDYLKGNCSEHMFLHVMIPHFSMGSLFQLETTSINTVVNTYGTLQKAAIKNIAKGGKISGEIFRIYKEQAELKYFDEKANANRKRKNFVVNIQHVPFDEYLKLYKDKIRPDDLEALIELRKLFIFAPTFNLSGPQETLKIETQPQQPQLTDQSAEQTTQVQAVKSDDEKLREIADHEVVVPLFNELGALLGKEATPAARLGTAKNFPDVQKLADYLKKNISKEKKKKAEAQKAEAAKAPADEKLATAPSPIPGAVAKPLEDVGQLL